MAGGGAKKVESVGKVNGVNGAVSEDIESIIIASWYRSMTRRIDRAPVTW